MEESDNLTRIGDGEQIYSCLEEILGTETQRMLVFIPHGSAIVGRLLKYGSDSSMYGDIEGFIFREAHLVHPEMGGSLDEDPNLKLFGGSDGLFTKDQISDSYLFLGGKKLPTTTYSYEDEKAIYQKHGFSEDEALCLGCNLFKPLENSHFHQPTHENLSLLEKLENTEEQTGYNLSRAVPIAIYVAMINLVAGNSNLAKIYLEKVHAWKLKRSQDERESQCQKGLPEIRPGDVVGGIQYAFGDTAHQYANEADDLKTRILDRYDEVKDRLVAALQEMDKLRVEKYGYKSLLEPALKQD